LTFLVSLPPFSPALQKPISDAYHYGSVSWCVLVIVSSSCDFFLRSIEQNETATFNIKFIYFFPRSIVFLNIKNKYLNMNVTHTLHLRNFFGTIEKFRTSGDRLKIEVVLNAILFWRISYFSTVNSCAPRPHPNSNQTRYSPLDSFFSF